MDESRNARQPKKPDNNELWSWIVIALLFAFAWPVGLIVLFAKLSDSSKRKKNRAGAQQTIITAEPEDAVTAAAAPTAAEKKSDSAAQSRKRRSSITRTPKISDSNANVMRNIGLVVTVIGAIILLNALGDNLFFLEYGNWRAFLEYTFWPMGITAGGLGLPSAPLCQVSGHRRKKAHGDHIPAGCSCKCVRPPGGKRPGADGAEGPLG